MNVLALIRLALFAIGECFRPRRSFLLFRSTGNLRMVGTLCCVECEARLVGPGDRLVPAAVGGACRVSIPGGGRGYVRVDINGREGPGGSVGTGSALVPLVMSKSLRVGEIVPARRLRARHVERGDTLPVVRPS